MDQIYVSSDTPTIEVNNGRLILPNITMDILHLVAGDKISINYLQINGIDYPIIGKAEHFFNPEVGNKLCKNGTISFRGGQNKLLTKFGNLFRLQAYKPNFFLMIPIKK